jgi:hypothetical protein
VSTDYYVDLMAGYRVDADSLEKKYSSETELVYEEQPRFDPKTGKPAKPESVLVGGGDVVWKVDNEKWNVVDYDFDLNNVLKAIGKQLKCVVEEECQYDSVQSYVLSLPVKLPKSKDDFEDHRLFVRAGFPLDKLTESLLVKLRDLGARLDRVGLKPGPLSIMAVTTTS